MREDFDTSSTSAIDWAEEFCETIKNMDGMEAIDKVTDPGFMVGWFANYWAAIHDPLCARIEALENPWISVEDRLPDGGQEHIAVIRGVAEHRRWREGDTAVMARIINMTHWMPLPPPPKQTQEDLK